MYFLWYPFIYMMKIWLKNIIFLLIFLALYFIATVYKSCLSFLDLNCFIFKFLNILSKNMFKKCSYISVTFFVSHFWPIQRKETHFRYIVCFFFQMYVCTWLFRHVLCFWRICYFSVNSRIPWIINFILESC